MFVTEVRLGDITREHCDVIVNAANSSLLGGGGVDGAIHRAAGPELLAECRRLGPCPTGKAKRTAAYRLPAKYVVHCVGPVWQGGRANEDALLASCYREAMILADDIKAKSIAFPAISTGAYGFPAERAARIAVQSVAEYRTQAQSAIERVVFVAFDETNRALLESEVRSVRAAGN